MLSVGCNCTNYLSKAIFKTCFESKNWNSWVLLLRSCGGRVDEKRFKCNMSINIPRHQSNKQDIAEPENSLQCQPHGVMMSHGQTQKLEWCEGPLIWRREKETGSPHSRRARGAAPVRDHIFTHNSQRRRPAVAPPGHTSRTLWSQCVWFKTKMRCSQWHTPLKYLPPL